MSRKTVVLIAFALVISSLFCTTPLTKGTLVRQETAAVAPASAPGDNAARNINTFPWTEDFEGTTFPPADWAVYNRDTQGDQWSVSTAFNHTPGGQNSACHLHSNGSIDEYGWLVTPLIEIPTGQGTTLSFWSYNQYPENYGTSTVLVSTSSPDPNLGNYSGIWSPVTVSDRWVFNMVDLTPWAGQSIYVAFWYRGFSTYEWYLDDVRIEEHSGVHDFPWEESFESGVFPPYYWWQVDSDGGGTSWSWNQNLNHSEDGRCSAMHLADSSAPEEDGWLISPQINIPAGSAYSLSFWSYNANPGLYVNGSNSVLVSTASPDPEDGDYFSIWSPVRVNDEWTYNLMDLTPWSGQAIRIAFRYQCEGSHDWYLDDVQIREYIGIQELPFTENFESGVFPPYYWTAFNADGVGTYWSWNESFNHSDDGNCSAMHIWDAEEPTEEGWLVSPLIRLPWGETNYLSFWSLNINPQWFGSNSVWLSTGSLDPADGDFDQIWSETDPTDQWSQDVIDLSQWVGQNVFLAFRYSGHDAHDWYLDDVYIGEVGEDTLPPVISHLPLLNTLRDDIPYGVFAEVTDDEFYNSGMGPVYLYYTVDGGEEFVQEMVLQRDGYYGEIPAQVLGSQIIYYIQAYDNSPQENMVYSPDYLFEVNDPVWIHYDSGTLNAWAGMTDGTWGVGTLYENPLYGGAVPLVVAAIRGSVLYTDTVTLNLYTASDTYLSNLTPLMPPLEVVWNAATWMETGLVDIEVTAPYVYITCTDIDAGNGFAVDSSRYYPDRNYLIWDGQDIEMSDVNYPVVWMFSLHAQSGLGSLPAPVLTITNTSGGPVLHWTAVPGASYYNIYASPDPFAPEPWGLFDSTPALELGALGSATRNFFKVTAASGLSKNAGRSAALPETGEDMSVKVPDNLPYQALRKVDK